MNKNTIAKLTISFDALQQTVPDSDVEFWFARDLMVQLGYSKWQNYVEVVHDKVHDVVIRDGSRQGSRGPFRSATPPAHDSSVARTFCPGTWPRARVATERAPFSSVIVRRCLAPAAVFGVLLLTLLTAAADEPLPPMPAPLSAEPLILTEQGLLAAPRVTPVVSATMRQPASPHLLFLGRFHIVLLHLPIGVLILVFLLEVDARLRRRIVGPPAYVGPLLMFGAAFAVITAVLGLLLARDPLYDAEALFWHKWTGVAAAGAAALSARLRAGRSRRSRALYWVSLWATMICLGLAGHHGGALTHGGGFLTHYLPDWAAAMRGQAVSPESEAKAVRPLQDPVGQVWAAHCVSCHGADDASGGLRLDVRPAPLASGKSGKPAIVPGDAMASEIVRRMLLPRDDMDAMPPATKPPVPPASIMCIVDWINSGGE